MNLHQIEIYATYSSLGIYGLGVLGFIGFAFTLLNSGAKHVVATILCAPVWPIFIMFALFREKYKK